MGTAGHLIDEPATVRCASVAALAPVFRAAAAPVPTFRSTGFRPENFRRRRPGVPRYHRAIEKTRDKPVGKFRALEVLTVDITRVSSS